MATKNPFQGDDYDFFEAARDESGAIKKEPTGNIATPKAQAEKPETKKETFREAFARNRAAGKDTFTWNGKKYTTELAKPAAKKTPAKSEAPKPTPAKPQTEMQRNTASNAAANRKRMEEQRQAREARKKKASESRSLFGRNPAGKTPAEVRKMAAGGSVRGYGIARGGKKCKMV